MHILLQFILVLLRNAHYACTATENYNCPNFTWYRWLLCSGQDDIKLPCYYFTAQTKNDRSRNELVLFSKAADISDLHCQPNEDPTLCAVALNTDNGKNCIVTAFVGNCPRVIQQFLIEIYKKVFFLCACILFRFCSVLNLFALKYVYKNIFIKKNYFNYFVLYHL